VFSCGSLLGRLREPLPGSLGARVEALNFTRAHRPRRRHPSARHPRHDNAATLVRVPSLLSFDELARAAHEPTVRNGTAPRQIEAAQARHPKAAGAARLRAIVKVMLTDLRDLLTRPESRGASCSP
jgi:hypothetical protein